MPQSLRSILGTSNRVKKPSKASPAKKGTASPSPRKKKNKSPEDEDQDYFPDRLEDLGISKLLAEELTLRDVVQAMRYIRAKMFTPVPPTGLNSTRTAEVLNYRAMMPPIVTVGHLNAVLNSPTRVEREVVELIGKGIVRRVRVERRRGIGEALIELSALESMVRGSQASQQAKDKFMTFLKKNPTSQTLSQGALTDSQTDEMVRAGFLTSSTQATPGTTLHIRPEDRTTLTSIQHVSRFSSGSVSAVGGKNAIHLAGGGGGGVGSSSRAHDDASPDQHLPGFRIAVPSHGRYLKLAEGAVDWVREALGRTKWGEAPETWLRERFEGGGLYGTRWKEFWGVEWEWVVGEALGLGVVEVFDTGSVGRGVRALGG